ncbi:MAG: winged helix-turn-helix transcriptional regulator [Candidatus Riflebacteria bacterium]|nr:winged helix-turn-helix transcriptional regulator [Candidatus Riflebacteria bacterium]
MKETLNTLRVLAEENRLRIFMALHEQELCVCQIVALLGLAASTTSKHLALMYQAGILDQRKEGRWAHYRVSREWLGDNARLATWLSGELAGSPRMQSDRGRLAKIFAMPPEKLCQPLEKCAPDKPVSRNRGRQR